ncbi:MAG: ribonuclease P protein component [Candidatus Margulisiibacteriota bacterium]
MSGIIRKKRHFDHLFQSPKAIENRFLRVLYAPPFEDEPKIAFVAGKKMGNAVKRNRAKRRLREICRQHPELLSSPVDKVFLAKSALVTAPFDEVLFAFSKLLHHLSKKNDL